MKKNEIETYMDAYMEGFWQCYYTMFDLIEDDEPSQEEVKDSQEEVKAEPKTEAPKQKIQKIDRSKVCALLDAGWKVPKIAGEMHASEATIYNIQKQHREEKAKQGEQAGELK